MLHVEAWPAMASAAPKVISEALSLQAEDGYPLAAHAWHAAGNAVAERGIVVINPATAVNATYYHRYARFLATQGFRVLTYDYRGIGASRQGNLRRWKHITKFDWGRLDCEAALGWCVRHHPDLPLHVVAHSIGGMTIGLAPSNHRVVRCLTVGAQFAYWPDYARSARLGMWLRWHLGMPLLTAALGYFPARALGWHEDLPAGAAYEWAFRGKQLRAASEAAAQAMTHFRSMRGEILAIGIADDPFGTPVAIQRLLAYFENCRCFRQTIAPGSVGESKIGHFAYFHEKFRDTLWRDSVRWLRDARFVQHPPLATGSTTAR
ncbi:alpha/beta hydrolase family protein [Viridibacterium curvum]|uniref:Alpha/beta fold hydrolase n=1 Tax=Viridibacterium curvum TaxID=1101404 RepID=A0ABP9QPV8_9RHOO